MIRQLILNQMGTYFRKTIFNRREFINLPSHNNMANIITDISINRYIGDDCEEGEFDKLENRHIEATLNIADCDRKITLDIETDNEQERENSLHKVTVLIDTLTEFKSALIEEFKIQVEREKLVKENRIKEKLKEEEERAKSGEVVKKEEE